MSKEPNETLVMTTCKCRENTKNLVMTRTYFNEMLENKIAWGAKQERERIIALLQERGLKLETEVSEGLNYTFGKHQEICDVIRLIQGEN
jgi:hypothetical protein